MPLTDAQYQALCKLAANGGEGVLDKHNKIIAQGVRLTGFDASTWLRLLTTGHLSTPGPNRIALTDLGRAAAVPPRKRVLADPIHGNNFQSPARLPGAE